MRLKFGFAESIRGRLEARIASGRLSRDGLLARFAPRAQGASMPHPRERVSLLLATDLLSEGVNLQDAAVVVHLDLPWNPARLAQRLGRIRRPGGAHVVMSYLMAPPARSDLLLRAEMRLRDKLAQAERTIGRGLEVLPALSANAGRAQVPRSAHALGGSDSGLAVAELRGEIHRILTRWRRPASSDATDEYEASGRPGGGGVIPSERSEPIVIPSERNESRDLHADEPLFAAARSSERGWIAVLDDGRLITSLSEGKRETEHKEGATDDTEALLHALRRADGVERATNDAEAITARRSIEQWIMHDWARRSCGLATTESPVRRRMLRRLESALGAVPRHRRRWALALATSIRAALEGRLPLGVERALTELPNDQDCARWLERAATLLSASADLTSPPADAARAARIRAIILLGPDLGAHH